MFIRFPASALGLFLTAGLACVAACGPTTPEDKFRRAVGWSDADEVRVMIEAGQDVNQRFAKGRTPLHEVAYSMHGTGEIARLLIDEGADVNARDEAGNTPWDAAFNENRTISTKRAAVFIALLEAGYEPELPATEDGGTFLHHAAQHIESSRMIGLLIKDRGMDPNARDDYGWTPLHVASLHRNIEAATGLLQNGADVNAETTGEKASVRKTLDNGKKFFHWRYMAGSRPLDVARYATGRGSTSPHDVLEEYGATKNPDVKNSPM